MLVNSICLGCKVSSARQQPQGVVPTQQDVQTKLVAHEVNLQIPGTQLEDSGARHAFQIILDKLLVATIYTTGAQTPNVP